MAVVAAGWRTMRLPSISVGQRDRGDRSYQQQVPKNRVSFSFFAFLFTRLSLESSSSERQIVLSRRHSSTASNYFC